jgi:hypothetical protein
MKVIILVAVLTCLNVFPPASAAEAGEETRGAARVVYGGWNDALSMTGGDCKLVVVPSAGGRVMSYALDNENIIFENVRFSGRTLSNTPSGFSPGGAQCDIGPELRGLPPHQELWNGAWMGRAPRPHVIHVISPPDMRVGIQLEKEFTMDPESGEVGVLQRMRNVINSDTSFCLWDRTLCKGGGFALMPLNNKSRFKARWAIREGKSGSYRYNGDTPSDARVRVMEDVLVVQARDLPDARELKVGTDTEAGWIGYVRERMLFVKYFPVAPGAEYTDGGCTLEFYCNDRVAELEPLSPEVKLASGQDYIFPEKWVLMELEKEVTSYAQARAVVKKIKTSPFRAAR